MYDKEKWAYLAATTLTTTTLAITTTTMTAHASFFPSAHLWYNGRLKSWL